MKKILLISDTHMENELFNSITKRHQDCDYFIHCGDSSVDPKDPILTHWITVLGNHDEGHFDTERFLRIEQFRVFITHGHLFNVYEGYEQLENKALKLNADLVFHGHTHIATYEVINNITYINPGSVMFNRGHYGFGTYAIVTIDNHQLDVHFYHHQTHEVVDSIVLEDGKILRELFKPNKL